MLGKPAAIPPAAPGPVISGKSGERRVEIALEAGADASREISADVERQYLVALFQAHGGNLDRWPVSSSARGASRRKVHLRMNQLGLRLRNLRAPA